MISKKHISELIEELVLVKPEITDFLLQEIISENKYLPRPLVNLNISVCNILASKGLGADVVFCVGFDQGRIPIKINPEDSEIFQLLVTITRAKKHLYLINTFGKQVSQFIQAIRKDRISVE